MARTASVYHIAVVAADSAAVSAVYDALYGDRVVVASAVVAVLVGTVAVAAAVVDIVAICAFAAAPVDNVVVVLVYFVVDGCVVAAFAYDYFLDQRQAPWVEYKARTD